MKTFGKIMFTDAVQALQKTDGSFETYARITERPAPDGLGPDEAAFIESRDSFYMATVNADGWPYIQHRGGPRGFLKVLGPTKLGFADYRGNRQFVSSGNLAGDDRVALFLMDYARHARLKILGHAAVTSMDDADEMLLDRLAAPGSGRVERVFTIEVDAFDWNCPQFIPTKFSEDEVREVVGTRIAELEAENARLKDLIAKSGA
ncbi:MAG: pyridoxamine 5'-phosphate oxidase family protein [Pseudomonadota bacterium]